MDKTGGYISIHRSFEKSWIRNKSRFCHGMAWIDLLMLARWKDEPIKKWVGSDLVEIGHGEVWTTLRNLADRWKWKNHKSVKDFLLMLEKDAAIVSKKVTKGTLIKITNYAEYQQSDEKEISKKVTRNSQTVSKQYPNDSQTISKQYPNSIQTVAYKNKGNKDNKENTDNKGNKEITLKNVFPEKPAKGKKSFTSEYSDHFEEFWKEFPKRRKGSKPKAHSIWQDYGLDQETMAEGRTTILVDLKWKKINDQQWKDGFEPMATTYLNGKGWESGLTPEQKKKAEMDSVISEKFGPACQETIKAFQKLNPEDFK